MKHIPEVVMFCSEAQELVSTYMELKRKKLAVVSFQKLINRALKHAMRSAILAV